MLGIGKYIPTYIVAVSDEYAFVIRSIGFHEINEGTLFVLPMPSDNMQHLVTSVAEVIQGIDVQYVEAFAI